MNAIDLTGKRYGRLLVLNREGHIREKIAWKCKCDCGNTIIVSGGALKTNNTASCGCLFNDRIKKHGMYKTKLYKTWANMKARCTCKKSSKYKNYGGRGIIVCEEWNEFENFMKWAIQNGYYENHSRGEITLDRIDVNGNYEPTNCRWISNKQQQLNKRTNVYLTMRGVTKTIAEWSKETGIHPKNISRRIKDGWTVEETLMKGVEQ